MRGTPLRRIAGIVILGVVLLIPHLASAQRVLVTGSLTVTGYGQASGPADLATVYLSFTSESAMMGPTASADVEGREAVAPIVDALVAEGIDEAGISVMTGPGVMSAISFYGPTMALIRFDIASPTADDIATAVEAATAAARDARLLIGGLSVRLGSNDCANLERDAREAAIADAHRRAGVMGELAGLLPGDITSVRDLSLSPESGFTYVNPVLAACSPVQPANVLPDAYGPATYDLTQEPTVTVYAQVEITFAVTPSILATPSG